VQFDWDYRLLEDTGETWKQMLDAYHAGAAELCELRMYLFNENRKTAQAVMNRINRMDSMDSMDSSGKNEAEEVEKNREVIEFTEVTESGSGDVEKNEELQEMQEVKKVHEVFYDGEICASKIFAPSGRFDNTPNPFKRDTWNMSEQAEIYRDNPEIVKYLMREAQM
jgi:hypothetical protein